MNAQEVLTWLQSKSTTGQPLTQTQLGQLTAELQTRLGQLSVNVPGGTANSTTLFYSGDLSTSQNSTHAWEVAEKIGKSSSGKVITIGETELGRLMNGKDFIDALTSATGGDAEVRKGILGGYTDSSGTKVPGLWDTASLRLADAATGDVRTLTPFADSSKVFGQTELPELLSNSKVTSINGIPKEIYTEVYDKALSKGGISAANEAVFNAIKYSSATLTDGITYIKDSKGTIQGVNTADLLEGTGIARQTLPADATNINRISSDYRQSISSSAPDATSLRQGGLALGEAEMSLLARGNTVAKVGTGVMGAGGTVLAGAATLYTANEINTALHAGDANRANALAKQLTASWTGGLAGSVAAGSLAAETLAPLLAGGPVGAATYLVLVGASTLVGGYWGTSAVDDLLSKLNFNPFGTTAVTRFDPVNFENVTEFGNGVVLRQLAGFNDDPTGLLFPILEALGRSPTRLDIPNSEGGFTSITVNGTDNTLTKWKGAPDTSIETNKLVIAKTDNGSEVSAYVDGLLRQKTIISVNVLGEISGTSVFTPSPDENNNPIPGVYDIVNKDGAGTVTATGVRTVNPITGAHEDQMLSAATPAAPNGSIWTTKTDANGKTVDVLTDAAQQNLASSAQGFNDAVNLAKAIGSGKPLPTLTSGLAVYNDITHSVPPELLGASGVLGAFSSLHSMDQALHKGDTATAIVSGANAFTQGVNSYISIAYSGDLINAAADGLGSTIGAASAAGEVLPYLNIANDLIHGNVTGAVADGVGFAVSQIYAVQLGVAAGPVGVVVGLVLGEILGDIFGDDPPQPWGSATAAWDASTGYTTIAIGAVGDAGGDKTASGTLTWLEGNLVDITTQYNTATATQPDLHIGIIPQRLGGLGYSSQSFHVSTNDPATGAALNPDLRFDATTGQTTNAQPGDPAYFQTLGQYYINNALARQAIAPEWEVKTAQAQAANHQSNAGLSEVERAAALGHLAAAAPSTATPQFQKQTQWLNRTDAFLVLDKNGNGRMEEGEAKTLGDVHVVIAPPAPAPARRCHRQKHRVCPSVYSGNSYLQSLLVSAQVATVFAEFKAL